ncbi:MAG TPA: hypothetical protein VEU33_19895 [Archangium sp.]|nr:hypothetical protein [Archangium sp.]
MRLVKLRLNATPVQGGAMGSNRGDVLLIETSLEEHLVDYESQRREVETFSAFCRTTVPGMRLFHERIHSLAGLRRIFQWCAEQNGKVEGDDRSPKTNIRHVHISCHGTTDSLALPLHEGDQERATQEAFLAAFSPLKTAGINTIFLSACATAKNKELAAELLKVTRAHAVVGYPYTAYDHVCSIAEQIFYFRLNLKPRTDVWDHVRAVNDSLVLLGVDKNRFLVCWHRESDGGVKGPYPWWGAESELTETSRRSYITQLMELVPERGALTDEKRQRARRILNYLRDL